MKNLALQLVLLTISIWIAATAGAKERPNILFIFTDDQAERVNRIVDESAEVKSVVERLHQEMVARMNENGDKALTRD